MDAASADVAAARAATSGAAQSDPRAFNTGAPDPRPRSRYGSMYVESAMRAYSVTNRWFNRTPPPDEVRTFLADLYRIANTLFP